MADRARDSSGRFVKGGAGVDWDTGAIKARTIALPAAIDAGVKAVMTYMTPEIESYMKSNAKWTDRTSNARNGLRAVTDFSDGSYAIVMFHSVPYGIWLEVRFSGRYAIIEPTVQAMGPVVMENVQHLLARL